MSRTELIERLMKIDFSVFGMSTIPMKGDLRKLTSADLAAVLKSYDDIRNAAFSVQRIILQTR